VAKPQCIKVSIFTVSIFQETRWVRGYLAVGQFPVCDYSGVDSTFGNTRVFLGTNLGQFFGPSRNPAENREVERLTPGTVRIDRNTAGFPL
jgi:hypothetical protein